MEFEWDARKETTNSRKHGVSFLEAQQAFFDTRRIIAIDAKHSSDVETRYFCFGEVKQRIVTVRFTVRSNTIRIFGGGYWREGRRRYEQENGIS